LLNQQNVEPLRVIAAEFVKSAVKPDHYPAPDHPEVAFAGRSNVGKSSLINTLVNRKRLVKTSRTPGRTQLINFFLINQDISFVDLPGYGYAKVPVAVQKTWKPMIETYFAERKNLRGVVLLLDIRRTPGVEERNLIDWLKLQGLANLLVLTKADKFSKTKQKKHQCSIAESLDIAPENLLLFSAKTRLGKDAVLKHISAMCDPR
jgi:GTP-binding protein